MRGRVWITILAAIFFAPTLAAQLPALDKLTSEMTKALALTKQKPVIVFDFWGPDQLLTALGQNLAQNFSDAMAAQPISFQVLNRAKITPALLVHGLSLSSSYDAYIEAWLAHDLGSKALVLGQLSVLGDSLEIELTSYKTEDQKWIAGYKLSVPMTNDMRLLLAKKIEAVPLMAAPAMLTSATSGYSYPKCIRCPQAEYDQRAVDQRLQRTVTLVATIGTDGKAHGIDVRQTIEATFHLYDN